MTGRPSEYEEECVRISLRLPLSVLADLDAIPLSRPKAVRWLIREAGLKGASDRGAWPCWRDWPDD